MQGATGLKADLTGQLGAATPVSAGEGAECSRRADVFVDVFVGYDHADRDHVRPMVEAFEGTPTIERLASDGGIGPSDRSCCSDAPLKWPIEVHAMLAHPDFLARAQYRPTQVPPDGATDLCEISHGKRCEEEPVRSARRR